MPDTMKIRYVGHSTNGVLIDATGDEVQHGHQVELPADIARSLLQQTDEWERVSPPKKPKKAAKKAATTPEFDAGGSFGGVNTVVNHEPEVPEAVSDGANEGDVSNA